MTDILIRHVTAVTLDARRRVLEDAAIAVEDRGAGGRAADR